MKVTNEIQIYEQNGEEFEGEYHPKLLVSSHWNRKEFAILKLPGGDTVTVLAEDLRRALENTQNSKSF